jgi:hypothetical protein
MADASVWGSRCRRALALVVCGTLGALLVRPLAASDREKPAAPLSKPASKLAASGSDLAEIVPFINKQLADAYEANKLTPSGRCTDHEFLRRAFLDIVGRIARPEEIKRYLSDPAESRRSLLINRLLGDEDEKKKTKYGKEYATNWANIWTVWLMTRAGATEEGGRGVYHDQIHRWLEEQFAANKSFKEIVSDLLTATGKTNDNGAVNYILAHLGEQVPGAKQSEEGQFEMVPVTSRTTRLFLGLQTQCTQCHDHPFNPEWKQHHFWGVNAFFRQVRRQGQPPAMNRRSMATVMELKDNPSYNREGIVYYEKRNGVVLPTKAVFLDGTKLDPQESATRRQQLSLLITRSPYFPKAYVNRLWGHFFGRGFTNPVDDFGEHNPVSHPELLDELGKKFEAYGYDTKRLIRWICNSDAYHLSSVANRTNDKPEAEPFFSRMLLKAMTPEQLFESLMVATQADMNMKRPEREKLRERWMNSLIVNFGDDEGNEVTFNGTVVQALLLMNGRDINDAISNAKGGTVAVVVSRNSTPASRVNELYLAALNRPPTTSESGKIMQILRTAPVRGGTVLAPWQDLFWALLNSNEFILNH